MPTNSLDCSFNLMEIGQLDIQTNVGHVTLFHITRYLHQTEHWVQQQQEPECGGGGGGGAGRGLDPAARHPGLLALGRDQGAPRMLLPGPRPLLAHHTYKHTVINIDIDIFTSLFIVFGGGAFSLPSLLNLEEFTKKPNWANCFLQSQQSMVPRCCYHWMKELAQFGACVNSWQKSTYLTDGSF